MVHAIPLPFETHSVMEELNAFREFVVNTIFFNRWPQTP
jgi:hypothetical protein